jgi:hypothetical protein
MRRLLKTCLMIWVHASTGSLHTVHLMDCVGFANTFWLSALFQNFTNRFLGYQTTFFPAVATIYSGNSVPTPYRQRGKKAEPDLRGHRVSWDIT